MPALLTRISILPNFSMAVATTFSQTSTLDKSPANVKAFALEAGLQSSMVWAKAASLRPVRTKLAPRFEKRTAVACPIPQVTGAGFIMRCLLVVTGKMKRLIMTHVYW